MLLFFVSAVMKLLQQVGYIRHCKACQQLSYLFKLYTRTSIKQNDSCLRKYQASACYLLPIYSGS